MLDVAACAMAFRLLRMNGYDVSSGISLGQNTCVTIFIFSVDLTHKFQFHSDELSHLAEASAFRSTLQGYLNDTKSLLELQKASTVSVSKNETILDNIGYWSSNLLKEKMSSNDVDMVPVFTEVLGAKNIIHKLLILDLIKGLVYT